MRKRILTLVALIAILSMALITVGATPIESRIGITVNNEIRVIPEDMGEPFLANSRTFVQLRFVSETLGFKVDWEQASRTVIIHGSDGQISVQIGNNKVSTPSGEVTMDVEAFLKDGRTYVPIRFVAEALDFEVDWIPAKNIEGSRDYQYDFYVSIDGELGNTNVGGEDNPTGITNIVSNNPEDWPETTNEWQSEPDLYLAKNKPYIDYLEANYEGKFHVAGYSITGYTSLGPNISFSPWEDQKLSAPAFYAIDLRETETGYIDMTISWYDVSKDVIQKSLYAMVGYEDGQYIFDYYTRGRTEKLTANEWIKTPSGREFQVDTTLQGGVGLYIK